MQLSWLRRNRIWIVGCLIPFYCLFFASCANTRKVTLMQGQFDTARLSQIVVSQAIIQKSDLLSIVVYSDNPAATSLYNQSLITTAGSSGSLQGATPSSPGYQVDDDGNIEFQGLGILHVEGLTKAQLKDTLDRRLSVYLKNPYYNIRFMNYRFTMLGEINRPGSYSIPGDRLSLFEALGIAGDLTFYGRRDNVLFIRQNNGKREFARLDLTKPEIMASPYFYLQQNDVVIIEANKAKVVANDQVTTRNVTIAATVISTLAIIYSIFHN